MMKSFTAPPPPTSLSDANAFFSPPPSTTTSSSSGLFPHLPTFNLPGHFLDDSHGFHPLPPPLVKPEPEQYRVPMESLFGQHQQPQQAFCFPSPNPSASATALLQKVTMMGITTASDGHESIDLLQDMNMNMNMNMTAMMMMSSISPYGGVSVGGILDPEGGGGGGGGGIGIGIGTTRDFLSLSRSGFTLPPPRKDDLLGMHGDDISGQMHEEEGDNDNGDHQGLWHG